MDCLHWLQIADSARIQLSSSQRNKFPWIGDYGFLVENLSAENTLSLLVELKSTYQCKVIDGQDVMKLKRVEAESFLIGLRTSSSMAGVIIIKHLDILAQSPIWAAFLRFLEPINLSLHNFVVIGLCSQSVDSLTLYRDLHILGRPLLCKSSSGLSQNPIQSLENINSGISQIPTFTDCCTYRQLQEDLLHSLHANTENGFLQRPSGIVIQGVSSSGKTHLLRWLITQLPQYHVIEVPSADLVHKEVGSSEKAVHDLYERARANAPTVLIFENFDILFGEGAMNSSNAFIRIQSILLTEIDISAQTQSVVTIVTATDLKNIDYAFLRPGRLEERVTMINLDEDERFYYIRFLLTEVLGVDGAEDIEKDEIRFINRYFNLWSIGKISSLFNEASFNLSSTLCHDIAESKIKLQWPLLRKEIERLLRITR